MTGRSADTSLAEIYYKMTDLFGRQLSECTKRRKLPGFTQLPQAHEKCEMKMNKQEWV